MLDNRWGSRSRVRVVPGRVVGVLAALAVLASLGTACSSESSAGGGTPTTTASDALTAMLDATMAAGSGRIAGSVDAPGTPSPGSVSGEWKGDLTGAGAAQLKAPTPQATIDAELRWTGNELYIRRSAEKLASPGVLSPLLRPADAAPWQAVKLDGGVTSALPAAFSPPGLLSWLKKLGASVEEQRTDAASTGGSTGVSHRYKTTRPVAVGVWVGATVELSADASNRVVGVSISSAGGGTRYDVKDFGVPVNVAAPPTDQISTTNEHPRPTPSGPFTEAKSGGDGTTTWSLEKAPGTDGTTCWRWNANPPLKQQIGDVRCLAPVAPDAELADRPQFLVFGTGEGSYDAVAVALPEGVTKLELGYVGGKTETVPVANPFVWVGPPSPFPAYLGMTFGDGSVLDCGAGVIASPADLKDEKATSTANVASWNCLPKDDS